MSENQPPSVEKDAACYCDSRRPHYHRPSDESDAGVAMSLSKGHGAEKDAGRPCYRCGKDPAEGYASAWTAATGERWYCHGDDDESPTCYEGANIVDPDAFGAAGYLLTPRPTPPGGADA